LGQLCLYKKEVCDNLNIPTAPEGGEYWLKSKAVHTRNKKKKKKKKKKKIHFFKRIKI